MNDNLDDRELRDPLDPPQIQGQSSADVTGVPGDDVADEEVVEIRVEIEQTRNEMSETIDAIQEKLSPENIAQQATDTVREATIGRAQQAANQAADRARVASGSLTETFRQNRTQLLPLIGPVTSLLVVLLILWRRRGAEQEVVEQPPAATPAGMALDRVRGTLVTAAGQGQTAARQATAQAREAAYQAGAGARRVALRQRAQTPPPSNLDRLRNAVSNASGQSGRIAGQARANAIRFVLRQQAPPPPPKPVDRVRNAVASAAGQVGSAASQAGAQARANAVRFSPWQQPDVETPAQASGMLDQLRATVTNAASQSGNAARQVGDQARTLTRQWAFQQQEPAPAPPPPPQTQLTVTTVRQAVEQNPATTVVALVAVVLAVLARFMDRRRDY